LLPEYPTFALILIPPLNTFVYNMPQDSLFQIEIPEIDIISYLYPTGNEPSNEAIWLDAEEPDKYSLSPQQLLEWVKRFGHGIQRMGLRDGDVVMVFSTNHIFMPVAYLGATAAGCIFTGANPAYSVDGMCYFK
jgi:4-coumarate--CoA ligase